MRKFWKKRDSEDPENPSQGESSVLSRNNVPMATLARWFIYDAEVDNPDYLASRLGLSPISPEGAEYELKDSRARTKNVASYIPFTNLMSDITSMAVADIQMRAFQAELGLDINDMPAEQLEYFQDIIKQVAFVAIYTSLSSALSLGIIVDPGVSFGSSHEQ